MDHDQTFKQLIRPKVEAFVRLFYPDIADQTDFSCLEPLDKEVFTDIPSGFRRESDIVARVREKSGKGRLFLFLVEIEDKAGRTRKPPTGKAGGDAVAGKAGGDAVAGKAGGETLAEKAGGDAVAGKAGGDEAEERVPIGERLFVYAGALWSRYRLPVFPIVLYLFQAKQGLVRASYRQEVFGSTVLELRYLTIGLPKLKAGEYLARGEALGAAFAALMNRGRWPAERLKAECLKVIMRSSETPANKFLAANCVETYLRLDEVAQRRLDSLLRKGEYMDYTAIRKTWADEMREEGKQDVLLKQLKLKFGSQSEAVEGRVREIKDPNKLDDLAGRILTASSLDEMGLG